MLSPEKRYRILGLVVTIGAFVAAIGLEVYSRRHQPQQTPYRQAILSGRPAVMAVGDDGTCLYKIRDGGDVYFVGIADGKDASSGAKAEVVARTAGGTTLYRASDPEFGGGVIYFSSTSAKWDVSHGGAMGGHYTEHKEVLHQSY